MSIPDLSPNLLPSGKFDQHPLVELLGIAFAHRRTGKLMLKRGRTTKVIFIFNGIPVSATSSSPDQGILDLMVRDHRLQPDDVLQVKMLAKSKGMDVERCLRELLEVTESQIYYYRQQAVRNIIIKACGWRDGFYSFESGDAFMSEIDMYDLNPLDLVFEGINKYRSTTLAADIHAIENRTLRLSQQNREYFLLPGPLYEHSDILDIFADGITVARAVSALQQEFADINLAVTVIYLLLLTGVVAFPPETSPDEIFDAGELFSPREPEAPPPAPEDDRPADESSVYVIARPRKLKKDRPKPKPVAPPGSSPVLSGNAGLEPGGPGSVNAPLPPRPEPRTPPPRPSAPPPAAQGSADQAKRVAELAGEIQAAVLLYDVLGATVANDVTQLQKFYANRRRLLLDGIDAVPADTRTEVEQALKTLEDAFARLTDPARRAEYEKLLSGEETKRAWNLNMKKLLARRMSDRGHWYLLNNAPEHARTFYYEAIQLDPEAPAYFVELGWAIFRHRPQEADEARSYLHNAVRIDPTQHKGYYYLGVIAKRQGDNEQAEKMLRRALELNPEYESARRELAYLNQHQKESSLWKKIFGG